MLHSKRVPPRHLDRCYTGLKSTWRSIMTYYGPKELAAAFRTVRNNTIKIAEEIPEAHYAYRVTPESRSVPETLAHTAVALVSKYKVHIVEQRSTVEVFDFFGYMAKPAAEEKVPRSKSEILELLHTEGEKFARTLEGLPEAFLAERVEFPQGAAVPSKSRFEMLLGPKEHEMHHRAQLMVVERLLGITPHLTRQMQERAAAMKAAQAGG